MSTVEISWNSDKPVIEVKQGSTQSDIFNFETRSFGGAQMPPALDGLTWWFVVSIDGTNFKRVPNKNDLENNAKRPDYTFDANECVTLWDELTHFPFVKIVCASEQTEDRAFHLFGKG